MRRTSVPLLVLLAVLAAGIGWLGQVLLIGAGRGTFVPPVTLIVGLLAVGALVLAFGWPVRQAVRGKRDHVDPFIAMRVVVLAKACALTGALLTGAAAGALTYDLTRPVIPVVGVVLLVAGALIAAVAVLVSGIAVESWCRIPPSRDAPSTPTLGLERH